MAHSGWQVRTCLAPPWQRHALAEDVVSLTHSIGAICNGKRFTPASRAVQGMLGAWWGEVTAWKTMASAMLRGGPRVPDPRDGAQHSSATRPFCQLSATPHDGNRRKWAAWVEEDCGATASSAQLPLPSP